MPSIVACPACGRPVRVPEELTGSRVKCPACAGEFEAPTALPGEEEKVPPLQGVPPPPRPLTPVLVSSTVTPGPPPPRRPASRECPNCGERLRGTVDSCPRCGEDLEEGGDYRPWERAGAPPRRDAEPHRGGLILALGVVGLLFSFPALFGFACPPFGVASLIGTPFGAVAWVLGQSDLRKMKAQLMDSEGLRNTETGRACGMVATLLGGLGLLLCGAVQLSQLVLRGQP